MPVKMANRKEQESVDMRSPNFFTWMFVLLPLLFLGSAIAANKKIPLFDDIRYIPGVESPAVSVYYGRFNPKVVTREMEGGKMHVLEFTGGSFPAALTRKIDTSSVPGPLLQIVPYNMSGKVPGAKVVLQFREPVKIEREDLNREMRFVLLTQRKKAPVRGVKSWQNRAARRRAMQKDLIKTRSAQIVREEDEATRASKELIETLSTPKDERIYKGTKVSIEASGVSVHDVFRLVGAASNLNLITDGEVVGTMDLSLQNVPWDQLLDIVLGMRSLKATAVGNVVRITTIGKYTGEQEAELALKLSEQKTEPVVMAIIPVNYADASEIANSISRLLVGATGTAGTAASDEEAAEEILSGTSRRASGLENPEDALQVFARGRIEIEERTNSLLITHTEKQVERIRELVKELDIPTPQILIEAKILNASENFARTLGVTWGGLFQSESVHEPSAGGVGFNGFTATATPPGAFTIAAPSPGGTLSFRLGGGTADLLDLALSVSETEGLSKTIASPRLIVRNKQSAQIVDGTKIAVQTADNAGGGTNVTTEFIDAVLNLDVTPQVTNSGFVLMDVNLTQDSPVGVGALRDISTQSITTQVLVESGSTLVLGGVYTYNKSETSEGVPILKDLPFLGPLFRADSDNVSRKELLMFISPRVIETSITEQDEGFNDESLDNEGVNL